MRHLLLRQHLGEIFGTTQDTQDGTLHGNAALARVVRNLSFIRLFPTQRPWDRSIISYEDLPKKVSPYLLVSFFRYRSTLTLNSTLRTLRIEAPNRNPAQHIHDNFPIMVISISSSDASIYQEESSSKRSSSRRARNASRSFQDYVCDDDNDSAVDDTDADEDFRPNSKRRSTASRRKTKKSSSPTTSAASRQTNGVTEPFPIKLHKMLEGNGANGMEHIASWQPHGRCFVVHNQQDFVDLVMPQYFQQSKYPSFQRQLNLYGFKRITRVPTAMDITTPTFSEDGRS